jgi:hypothetical protein
LLLSLGEAAYIVFCVQPHQLTLFELFIQERETCNNCVVQQYFLFQIGVYLQVKETIVSFYVHQHWFLIFWSFSQEEGTRVVFCVQSLFS